MAERDPMYAELDAIYGAEKLGARQQFSRLRKRLEAGIHRRGIGRSGFAGDLMQELGQDELSALADVEGRAHSRLLEAEQNAREEAEVMKAAKKSRRGAKRGWLGGALGAAGAIAGTFIAPGVGTMMGAQLGQAAGGAFNPYGG